MKIYVLTCCCGFLATSPRALPGPTVPETQSTILEKSPADCMGKTTRKGEIGAERERRFRPLKVLKTKASQGEEQ